MENTSRGEDRSSFAGIKTSMKHVFMNSDTFLEEKVTIVVDYVSWTNNTLTLSEASMLETEL